LIHLICFQDTEEGFGKGVITEEAIGILVNSYKASEIKSQVQLEVTKISESVSIIVHSSIRPGLKKHNIAHFSKSTSSSIGKFC
jgi:hypothetical protein